MTGRLEGRVAIITGSSQGLGQYCALGYAKEGAKIAVVARTDDKFPGTIYHTADLINSSGGDALPIDCNVANEESIKQMTQQVLARWGRVDILINNAAINPPGANADIQEKHWKLIYSVNVHGPFYCTRAVLPAMLEQQQGNIINISSGGASWGTPYGGTKRAVEAMTEGFGAELHTRGVAVNALKPVGLIETPGSLFAYGTPTDSDGSMPDLSPPDSYVEASVLLACQTPEIYTGQVNNDAEVIANLADDETKQRFRQLNPDYWVAAMDGLDWPA